MAQARPVPIVSGLSAEARPYADPELFAGIAVADLGQARHWVRAPGGPAPDFLPNDNEAVWYLGGHWLDLRGRRRGPRRQRLDYGPRRGLDARVAVLAERGLETEPIDEVPGVVRKAAITDPEGNRITFGESLGRP